MMAMLEIAMMGKVPYTVCARPSSPTRTLAESLNNLFGNFTDGRSACREGPPCGGVLNANWILHQLIRQLK